MRTNQTAALHMDPPKPDLTDLVFESKNKEYGAFTLRKSYSRFLTTACIFACTLFILGFSSPLVISYLKGTMKNEGIQYRTNNSITIGTVPPKTDEPAVQKPTMEPVAINKVEFIAPRIVPNDVATENYVPPVETDTKVLGGCTTDGQVTNNIDELTNLPGVVNPGTKIVADVKSEKETIFTFVEEMPHFPGGDDELMKYFMSSIKYPPIAIRSGVEGIVFVQFIVNRDGSISNVHIGKSLGAGCDEEALRVIKAMPTWIPGKQNGRAVTVMMTAPISFRLR